MKCRLILWATLAAVALGCAKPPPYGVEALDSRAAFRQTSQSVFTTGEASTASRQVLERLGLAKTFEDRPEDALARLHEGIESSGDEDRVFALAELSFLHGQESGDQAHSLAAAVYAYAFLFPGSRAERPDPFDPRFRLACELYNRGLTAGLRTNDEGPVRLSSRSVAMPFGSLKLVSNADGYRWAGFALDELVPATDYAVRGLRNRYRQAGVGAPLAASLSHSSSPVTMPPGQKYIPQRLRLGVTAFMRIGDPRGQLSAGSIAGELELHAPEDRLMIAVDGIEVPLEYETTLPLALTLEHSRVWSFERSGLRAGDMTLLQDGHNLVTLRPHQAGKIPVVLVHGTGSSAGRWAELINELENDRRIRERFQLWLFSYNSDNPIALSGAMLRNALRDVLASLDPNAADRALQQVVVIGHSQGGLLTKLTAVSSGNRFWEQVSDTPLEELDVKPETRRIVRDSLFVEPLPAVSRLVFIATPHRGSYLTRVKLAGWSPSAWLSSLIKLPGTVTQAVTDVASAVLTGGSDARSFLLSNHIPTSIDNMTPGNPFLQTLVDLPIAPTVSAHSIIAVKGEGDYEEGSDGVVKYKSAHLDDVESELVVRSGHSVQGEPETIEEVRRILLLHASDRSPP